MLERRTSLLRPIISCFLVCALSVVALARTTVPARKVKSKLPARALKAPQVGNPSQEGRWGPVIQLDNVPVHISLLKDRRLLYWARDKAADGWDRKDGSRTYLHNLDTNVKKTVNNSTTNLFCSGHSFLQGGRLLVTGGHDRHDGYPSAEGIGERDINLFDPATDTWLKLPGSMAKGRWYPFNVTLADGSVMIFSGTYWDGTITPRNTPSTPPNDIPERFIPTGNGVLQPYTASGLPTLANYPYLHLTPDNKVLIAGPSINTSYIFDPFGNGGAGSSSSAGTLSDRGFYEASSVTYDAAKGKVIMAGGRTYNATTISDTLVMDLSVSNQWRPAQQLHGGRKYHTMTLLPDGKVIVTGGTRCHGGNTIECPEGAAHRPELWDPAAAADPTLVPWVEMAPSPSGIPRVYHSTALLLPSGKVFVGGGGLPAAGGEVVQGVTCTGLPDDPMPCKHFGHANGELFSPPYLFLPDGTEAPRPVITKTNGVNFSAAGTILGRLANIIETPNAQEIASVVLVRNGSVTHTFNQDQRRVVLDFVRDGNTVVAMGPAGGTVAPPGPYMLFLINQNGTPSVAQMVEVTYPAVNGEQHIGRRSIRDTGSTNYLGTHHINVFYRHINDRTLRYMSQTASDSATFTTPVDLGGLINSNPLAIKNLNGSIEVIALGADNTIFSRRQTAPGSTTWTAWQRIGAGVSSLSAIAVARNLDGRIQIFYRGGDNALWYIAQTGPNSTTWTQPASLGGQLTTEPAVGMNADGRLEVFARWSDNSLYHRAQTAAGSGSWSNWHGLGGILSSAPFVAHHSNGSLDVFVRGTDAGVWHVRQSAPNSTNWAWEGLGGSINGDHISYTPVAALAADGRVQVFVRWSDNTLRTLIQNEPNGTFPLGGWGWYSLWGDINASLSPPVRSNNGRFFIFARGFAANLFVNRQTDANFLQWSGFEPLGDGAHSF